MNKLKTIIHYECMTSIKYVAFFYAIQFSLVALVTFINTMSNANKEIIFATSALEINSLIYIGILGILGFHEDFKMLIQNGFSRKYIFISVVSMFAFISATMAFVDTLVGNLINYIIPSYSSYFAKMYEYHDYILNFVILFLIYLLVCVCLYFGVLVVNKLGKKISMYLGVALGGGIVAIFSLFGTVIPYEAIDNLIKFICKLLGYMGDGQINFFYPIFSFSILIAIVSFCSYAVIRRTELKQ